MMVAPLKLQICSDRCGIFDLPDRSNEAARRLHAELSEFLTAGAISQLVMRSGAIRGQYNQHPLAFKVEAILQVIRDTYITFADPTAIDRWIESEAPILPVISGHRMARVRHAQTKAVDTAAFGFTVQPRK
jgi:hypothetical protein